jgi:conserved membrane protein yrbG
MGKREIGELSIMDLIVSILIAELAAMAIDKYKSNVFISLVPICALVIIQIITAKISLKSPDIREKIEGEPSIIINRGKVNFEEMLNQRYNLDDLLTQLREKSIKSLEEVDYAILETSGKLSVFLKDKDHSYPLPVILDGKVDKETLVQIGKDEEWLNKRLKDNNVTAKQVFYAFYKNKHLFFIENENVK